MEHDMRIDTYIGKAAPFAQPILEHIRARLHATLPELTETIKWGMPFFELEGRPFAMMAAFKAHAAFGFWKGAERTGDAMGHYGKLTTVADLPDDRALAAQIGEMAVASRAAAPRRKAAPKADLAAPEDLLAALAGNPAAQASFDGFPPGARREYVEWIVEAKRPETRAKRLEQAVAQMAEGKRRNWKYEKC